MPQVTVHVQDDFLERVARVRPLLAVQELVWNGLDAGATEVVVAFDLNELGGVTAVHVWDNGTGIDFAHVNQFFGSLGGSWKREAARSPRGGRTLHGKAGRGRFRAFALGGRAQWHSVCEAGTILEEFTIDGVAGALGTFEVSDPRPSPADATGTDVCVTDIGTALPSLLGEGARALMTQEFALYLTQYKDARIRFDGADLDPDEAVTDRHVFDIPPVPLLSGGEATARVELLEWKARTARSLVLCDADGFPRHEMPAGMPSQGYDFTAYVRSETFARLDEDDALLLEEMDPDVQRIIVAAREGVAEHFRAKAAQAAVDFVDRWQREHVYPYRGEPKGPAEAAGRQTFDVLALALNSYLPGFSKAPPKQRELALRLLRQSLEAGPEAVGVILREVLDLPAERQAEMNRLLRGTSLSAVIAASKMIADRLDFLRGLEVLLFDPPSREALLERRQLHKILERETWVLGEQYHLTASDRSLTEVLDRHLALLRPGGQGAAAATGGPVTLQEGPRGIVDLMLSRRVLQTDPRRREHLIVELKRPSQRIDDGVLLQVKNYARAVAADERFRDTGTRWVFWALSNEMSPSAEREANQAGRPAGLAYADGDAAVEVWARTWGQVLEDCRARLELYARELEYEADDASAMDYLRRTHEKYLPTHLKAANSPKVANSPEAAGNAASAD